MHPRTRIALFSATLLTGACTFNVRTEAVEVSAESPAPVTRLRADLRALGDGVSGVDVTLRPGPTAGATVRVAALVNSNTPTDELRAGVRLAWTPERTDATRLGVSYTGTWDESVFIDAVSITLPEGRAVELTLGASSLDGAGVRGDATVQSGSGSITLRDALAVDLVAGSGSLDVQAERATRLATGSGSIRATLTGHLATATAGSGSIRAVVGSAAALETGSGSIHLTLTGATLAQDLTLTAGSGSVELVLACGTAARLDLAAGSGAVRVDAPSSSTDGTHAWTGALNGGGARVIRARTGSGSIRVTERCGA
ncbi:MAG: DUF4097 family beta strand repeat-containing protein [Polyangiales bacterium]